MSDLQKKFGRNLKFFRLKACFTQEGLSDLTGLSVDQLSLIERGVSAPSFKSLEKISKMLKIPVYRMFDFRGKTN